MDIPDNTINNFGEQPFLFQNLKTLGAFNGIP